MPFQPPPRPSSVLACALAAAGIMLTVASCTGHVTPLGPDPAAPRPQPHQGPPIILLASPIILEAMLSKPPTSAGGCPAGYVMLAAPGQSPACYRKLGTPVTFTSAAVTLYQPPHPPGEPAPPPGASGILITVPPTEQAALTAVTTKAYDSRGAVDISVAGKTWAIPRALAPLTQAQFQIVLPSRNQALQLQHTLVPPS